MQHFVVMCADFDMMTGLVSRIRTATGREGYVIPGTMEASDCVSTHLGFCGTTSQMGPVFFEYQVGNVHRPD